MKNKRFLSNNKPSKLVLAEFLPSCQLVHLNESIVFFSKTMMTQSFNTLCQKASCKENWRCHKPSLTVLLDMTHSQMLGKFEYTLPAKF